MQTTYNDKHELNQPHPTLLIHPQYKSSQLESFIDSDTNSDTDTDIDIDILPNTPTTIHNSDDYLEDDMIIDNEEDHYPDYTNDTFNQLHPPPISNIFMNHPCYNTENNAYIHAFSLYLRSPQCLATSNPNTIQIPMNIVEAPIISPEKPRETITITAAADSQSDIEAIGPKKIKYYQQHKQIKTDKYGITIYTGNGPIFVKKYVPITVYSRDQKAHTRKFWCLDTLPAYDYLFGRRLLHNLGWEYRNRYDTWEHKPHNLDHVNTELDDLPGTNYPWKGEKALDIDKVEIKNPALRPFLKSQLAEYREVLAKHEWDSGKILDIPPFSIDLIKEEHPLKEGFLSKEYWTNDEQRKEIQRQLDGMIEYDKI